MWVVLINPLLYLLSAALLSGGRKRGGTMSIRCNTSGRGLHVPCCRSCKSCARVNCSLWFDVSFYLDYLDDLDESDVHAEFSWIKSKVPRWDRWVGLCPGSQISQVAGRVAEPSPSAATPAAEAWMCRVVELVQTRLQSLVWCVWCSCLAELDKIQGPNVR